MALELPAFKPQNVTKEARYIVRRRLVPLQSAPAWIALDDFKCCGFLLRPRIGLDLTPLFGFRT